MAYGVAKALTENLSLGHEYFEIKKIISINIVYFDLGQGDDYIYIGGTIFKGLHQHDTLSLSAKQINAFSKVNVSDIFPEFYIIKVNNFNDIAKDSLDEWIYFLKNSEVKDGFKAQGLIKAGEILDIMRLSEDDTYSYNRYLDYLHYKASEIFSLKSEAEYLVREDERNILIIDAIKQGLDDSIISKLFKIPLETIIEMRKNI
jgi:hypothetical protein